MIAVVVVVVKLCIAVERASIVDEGDTSCFSLYNGRHCSRDRKSVV